MLTPEQRAKLKAAGYSDTKINVFEAQKAIKQKEVEAQQPGYVDRLKGAFQERREEVKNINSSSASLPEKILQNVGQIAGGATDIVTEAPGIKQGLDLVGKGIAKVPGVEQVAEKAGEAYNQIPERARKNIEAIGNIASIIPVGLGAKGSIVAGEKVLATGAKAGKAIKTGAKTAKKVAGEIIPSADRVVNFQVSKALDLTAGDIKNINLATGNEVGEFMARKNLIRGNKVETAQALQDFFDTNYKTVRGEIGKVSKQYKQAEIPRYKQALEEIQKQVGETTGLETATKEIDTLLKKKVIKLDDVQRAKELLDEHFSLYKVTGDVKEGVAKQGLSNIRKELKDFIEKEVRTNTGSDIGALNNEVSTAKSTLNAIEARSTRGLTASNIKMGDFGTAGVGFMVGGIPGALIAVAGKKVLGTSAVRLKFAKWLDAISDAKKLRIQKELEKGIIPEEVSRVLNQSKPKAIATAKTINKSKNSSISPNTTTKSLKVKGEIPTTRGQAKINDPSKFERAKGLSPEKQVLEDKAFAHVAKNEDKIIREYFKKHGKDINADNFRQFFKEVGYTDGSLAAGVQEPSSYLAKRARTLALQNEGNYVVGTAGGSGVGKTSAAKAIPTIAELHKDAAFTLDSNFSSIKSARNFIDEVKASGKEFVGVYTYREFMDALENGIIKRMLTNKSEMGRLVPNKITAGNHVNSWDVVKQLNDEGYKFHFIDNSLGAGKAQIVSRSELASKIKYPPIEKLTQDANAIIKKLYESKKPFVDEDGVAHYISKKQYDALIE